MRTALMGGTDRRRSGFYSLSIFVLLVFSKCDSAPDFELNPVFNGTSFECKVWNAVPGEFGQEIGQTTYAGENCIYYLTGEAKLMLYSFNGQVDSIRIPPSIKKRVGIAPGEVIGYCISSDYIWINSPMIDSVYKLSIDLSTIDAFHVNINDFEDGSDLNKGLGLISCKRHQVKKYGEYILMPIHQHHTTSGVRDQVPANYCTIGMFKQDAKSLKLSNEFAPLPAGYYSQNMYFNTSSYNVNGDTLIVNYHYSDSVDLYYKGNLIRRVEMKSSKSAGFSGLQGPSLDIMAVKEHQMQHPRYLETVYDIYRNLYYRTYLVESKNEQGKIIPHEKWRLLVYDPKLRLVNEFEFKCMDLSPSTLFIVEEGILFRDFRSFDSKTPGTAKFELLTWEEKEF